MNRRTPAVIILMGLQILTCACARERESTKPSLLTLRIPDTPFMALLPLYVADEEGLFRTNGIEVEWLSVPDPGQARNLVVAGKAEVTLSTFANLLAVYARDPNTIQLVLPFFESGGSPASYLLVRPASGITSIRSLKGKNIGTYSGPSQKVYAEIVLDQLGYSVPKDVRLIQVSEDTQVQAFLGGAFDIFFAVEPFATLAITKGAVPLEAGVRTRYIADPFWVGAIAVSKRFTNAHPEAVTRIENSMRQAIDYMVSHPEEARNVLSKRARVAPAVASRTGLYTWVVEPSPSDCSQIQQHADLLFARNLLQNRIAISDALPRCRIAAGKK